MLHFAVPLVLLLGALPGTYAGNLIAQNNCNFPIWCGAAKNDGTFSPSVQVPAGGQYLSPKPAYNDNVGAVAKCGMTPGLLEPYQLELAVKDGRSWLDLSSITAAPFKPFHRHAEIAGTECVLDCQPWQGECEYPTSVDCQSMGDAIMTLC
ncbi:hypothetical protein F4802DRAFT_594394 [Xylaria palmicola]|nr:hypothetical protein F4802DRAFT_594394 [Xylaria palmicola]